MHEAYWWNQSYGVWMQWSVAHWCYWRSVRDTCNSSLGVITKADCGMRFFALKPSKSIVKDSLRISSLSPSLPPSLTPSLSLSHSVSLLPFLCLLVIFSWQQFMMINLQSSYFIKLQVDSGRLAMDSRIAVYLILILLLTLLGNLISPAWNCHQNLYLISYNELIFEVEICVNRLLQHILSKGFPGRVPKTLPLQEDTLLP